MELNRWDSARDTFSHTVEYWEKTAELAVIVLTPELGVIWGTALIWPTVSNWSRLSAQFFTSKPVFLHSNLFCDLDALLVRNSSSIYEICSKMFMFSEAKTKYLWSESCLHLFVCHYQQIRTLTKPQMKATAKGKQTHCLFPQRHLRTKLFTVNTPFLSVRLYSHSDLWKPSRLLQFAWWQGLDGKMFLI